jgi:hypothetical protein
MKNTTIALRRIAITTGLLLGSFALAAMAGSWSAPGSTPPNGNVDAPINVGSSFQEKLGALMVHGLSINGGFMFNPGGSISAGQVLTAKDNIGTVGWTAPTTGGGGATTGSIGGGCHIRGMEISGTPVSKVDCFGNAAYDGNYGLGGDLSWGQADWVVSNPTYYNHISCGSGYTQRIIYDGAALCIKD